MDIPKICLLVLLYFYDGLGLVHHSGKELKKIFRVEQNYLLSGGREGHRVDIYLYMVVFFITNGNRF